MKRPISCQGAWTWAWESDTILISFAVSSSEDVESMVIADRVFTSIALSSSDVCGKYDYSRHGFHFICIIVLRGMSKVWLWRTLHSCLLRSRLQRYVQSMIIADTWLIFIAFSSSEVCRKYDYRQILSSCSLHDRPQRYVQSMIIADTIVMSIAFASSEVCRKYDDSWQYIHFHRICPRGMSKVWL